MSFERVEGAGEERDATEVARDKESPGVGGYESFVEGVMFDEVGIEGVC